MACGAAEDLPLLDLDFAEEAAAGAGAGLAATGFWAG